MHGAGPPLTKAAGLTGADVYKRQGFFFTLFAIAIAAAETAVAIAIIINIYRNLRNIEVKNLDELKD